jgi:hypothetical protein
VIEKEPRAAAGMNRLNTVSLRLRVIAAVMAVLAVILILLSIAVSAMKIARSSSRSRIGTSMPCSRAKRSWRDSSPVPAPGRSKS